MNQLSDIDVALLATVAKIDVMDVAGRIIASPRRARVSLADELALALAVERLQGVAIEASLLVAALDLPETGNQAEMAVKDHAVQTQLDRVRTELTALVRNITEEMAAQRGGDEQEQEEENGKG